MKNEGRLKFVTKILVIVMFIFFSPKFVEAERIQNNHASTGYKNQDGSLDFDAFYEDMKLIPNDYYIYIKYKSELETFNESVLMKWGPGADFVLDNDHDVEFTYIRAGLAVCLKVLFSPYRYSNALDSGYVPMGIKRDNYGKFVERWNYYINQINETRRRLNQ